MLLKDFALALIDLFIETAKGELVKARGGKSP
jgi:hypothetical protein